MFRHGDFQGLENYNVADMKPTLLTIHEHIEQSYQNGSRDEILQHTCRFPRSAIRFISSPPQQAPAGM